MKVPKRVVLLPVASLAMYAAAPGDVVAQVTKPNIVII